jgi:hypothetical protein
VPARLLAFLLLAGPAAAPEPAPGRFGRWKLDLSAQTTVPVDIAGRIDLETPKRLQLTTSLGVLPSSYVDVINAAVQAAGGYDEATARLIRSSLQRSLVWRSRVGWRPRDKGRFFFGVGYGLVALGGEAQGSDVVAALTGAEPPEARPGTETTEYDINTVVHMIDLEIGWRFLFLKDRLVLRTAIGYIGSLAATTRLDPSFEADRPPLEVAFRESSEAELDALIERYFHAPVLSVTLGWRAF